jgi:hypothetical protein
VSAATAPVYDRTIIDYLRVTHDEGGFLRDILRGPVETLRRGLGVYPFAERDGHGAVYCAGGPEGGRSMLQMSGEPLAAWRGDHDEQSLIGYLASRGVRCTRIDLARDTAGEWTPERLRSYLDAERYVTLWRKAPRYTYEQHGPLSVYLGSRQSDFMLRVYDKRGEMLAKEKPCPHERLSRWEAQIADELAAVAFVHIWREPLVIFDDTGEATGGDPWPIRRLHSAWISQRLRLTTEPVRRESKEQSRSEADPDWTAFVADSDGSELLAEKDARTPEVQAAEFARSFIKGCAGSVSTFAELAGPEGMAELLRYGAARRSAKHRMFIERMGETRPAVRAALEKPRTGGVAS